MSRVDQLPARIGFIIDKHIKPVFVPGCKVTVLVRWPDDPEGAGDVLVSDDSDEGIRAIVDRRLAALAAPPEAAKGGGK